MPNRIVREGIISSRKMADLVIRGGWEAEVFYRRLINKVDDFGRYTADPVLLRTDLFPRQLDNVREANMERNLAHCRDARLIRLYEVNGEPYLVILRFRQRSRASTSKYPPPPDGDDDDGHVSDTRPTHDGHPPTYSETNAETETDVPKIGGVSLPNEIEMAFVREVFRQVSWLVEAQLTKKKLASLIEVVIAFGPDKALPIMQSAPEKCDEKGVNVWASWSISTLSNMLAERSIKPKPKPIPARAPIRPSPNRRAS